MELKKLMRMPDDGVPGGNPVLTPGTDGKAPDPEPTFTKSQVNELMKKRVNRSHNAFFTRYGVKDMAELDALFGKASGYDDLKKDHDELGTKYSDLETNHKDLTKKYAYKVGNVNPEKIADIEAYFKGKGIDIDENTLMNELKTHKDWANKPAAIVEKMGAEVIPSEEFDEKAEASRIFGVPIK